LFPLPYNCVYNRIERLRSGKVARNRKKMKKKLECEQKTVSLHRFNFLNKEIRKK